MPPDSSLSILGRMAGARAEGAAPVAEARPAPALERAMATAALRVADGIAGLGLDTAAWRSRRLDQAQAFEGLDAKALCLMIDPPGMTDEEMADHSSDVLAAMTGLIVLSPSLTDALVEVQTIGRVDGAARPARRPTRIDAALAQPFARALLDQVKRLVPPDSDEPKIGTLRTGSFVAGPESLSLILNATRFLRLDLDLELGDGARRAILSVFLPMNEMPVPQVGEGIDPEAGWKAAMRAAAMDAPVLLQAVLPPLRVPLSQLLSLKVGDLVPLPPHALTEIALHGGSCCMTRSGRTPIPRGTSMVARLGQLNGVRAVKIAALPGETASTEARDEPTAHDFGGMSAQLAPSGSGMEMQPSSYIGPSSTDGLADGQVSPSEASGASGLPDLPDVPDLMGLTDTSDLPPEN